MTSLGRTRPASQMVTMMNGEKVVCGNSCLIEALIESRKIELDCLVANVLPGYAMLLGMDAIRLMGGMMIDGSGNVVLGNVDVGAIAKDQTLIQVLDKDFTAKFSDGRWVVKWNWNGQAPQIRNRVEQYSVHVKAKEKFEEEVEEWIKQGWLQEYFENVDGVIPLMAVIQTNKQKVRPVLDYRELNQFISVHTGESEVCSEKLRLWRRMGRNVKILDLKKAYLQLHVAPELWKYQVVRFKGKTYCLTRLGFGLNVAPKIMSAVVNKVLSLDSEVRRGTDSYVDDIIVDEDLVSSDRVKDLFRMYGLECKDAEPLVGGRVLGLRVFSNDDELYWKRDNVIGEVEKSGMTKRDVFSLCGQLLGHFPVASWLRPACSFIKRTMNGQKWDEKAKDKAIKMLQELLGRVRKEDPVKGPWSVMKTDKGKVWCDASSLAMGVCVEIDGIVVEDAAWLRKQDDVTHINLAELESTIKGINSALRWNLRDVEIVTDSVTVHSWLNSILTGDRRVKTRGLGEALVRRRLALVKDLVSECNVALRVTLVRSQCNKADVLTRVPRKWLELVKDECLEHGFVAHQDRANVKESIQRIHNAHHLGVDRTLYVVRQCLPEESVKREEVEDVVRRCVRCKEIDPAPVQWEKGALEVDGCWMRLACDVTHYRTEKYLTMVDCGPSRFAVWKRIPDEKIQTVVRTFNDVFRERGPPSELLLDNYQTFRSQEFQNFCKKWGLSIRYRCAYKPGGNGIVERNHRTIKRMAARTGADISDMVYWYNATPKNGVEGKSTPASSIYNYTWRFPYEDKKDSSDGGSSQYAQGDQVVVKPSLSVRCTTRWKPGTVTSPGNGIVVEVDGVPRHVSHVRGVSSPCQQVTEDDPNVAQERPRRDRRPPARFGDYIMDDVNIMEECG